MAKILPIIINPNSILRKKSLKIKLFDLKIEKIKMLCADMKETMIKKDGVGLAAPQIGQNLRLIAINSKAGAKCLVNPEIIKKSWRKEWGEEGCLSVPGTFGQVNRWKSVICKYMEADGRQAVIKANGLMAKVIQHEIDHLDGILFIDKAKKIKNIANG